MTRWAWIVVPAMVLGIVTLADAKGGKRAGAAKASHAHVKVAKVKKHHGKALKGTIVSVATDGSSIVVQKGKKQTGSQVTVQTSSNTAVTIDGTSAQVTSLQAGEKVKVTPASGTATTIVAKTKKHHKK